MMGYSPNEVIGEERKNRNVDRVGNGYRLCMLGDLNRWIGNRVRAIITGIF